MLGTKLSTVSRKRCGPPRNGVYSLSREFFTLVACWKHPGSSDNSQFTANPRPIKSKSLKVRPMHEYFVKVPHDSKV